MKKQTKTPYAALGTAVISMATAAAVQADANPFQMTELNGGYMQVAEGACGGNMTDANGNSKSAGKPATGAVKKSEGSCGEGMCGGMMQGDKMKQGMEHSCGAMMKGKDGACGMDKGKNAKPAAEGSCGAMMGGKAGEGSCGAMMKGGQGSCGAKIDAEKAAGK